MSTPNLNILAIAGSLRKASLHRALIRSLQDLAPDDLNIESFDLIDIPLFNQDVEDENLPEAVQALRSKIEQADGIIWATPEYNGVMSGVIKNAIDWTSRQGLLARRPTTVISGSPGSLGATKAQESYVPPSITSACTCLLAPHLLYLNWIKS